MELLQHHSNQHQTVKRALESEEQEFPRVHKLAETGILVGQLVVVAQAVEPKKVVQEDLVDEHQKEPLEWESKKEGHPVRLDEKIQVRQAEAVQNPGPEQVEVHQRFRHDCRDNDPAH